MDNNDTTPKSRSEEIEALFEAGKSDEAENLIRQFIEEEPENLDAHAWAGIIDTKDRKPNEHFLYIFDRDITYDGPYKSSLLRKSNARYLLLIEFIIAIHKYDLSDTSEKGQREIIKLSEQMVSYCEKFLAARLDIENIHDFAEALMNLGRYNDVIKLADYTSGKVTADQIGWPGLDFSKSLKSDELSEMETIALDAYFLSKRYIDGCRWIYDLIVNKKIQRDHEYYEWFLLGQTLAWLGYPEETARAWIIALEKGHAAFDISLEFETLLEMISDPDYEQRHVLKERLLELKNKIPKEKKPVLEEIRHLVHGNRYYSDKLPSEEYIESKLGVSLPPARIPSYPLKHDRLLVASKRSNDPFVKEVIELLNTTLGSQGQAYTGAVAGKSPIREKVKVGGQSVVAGGRALEEFGVNLTNQAGKGDMPPIVGRDREIERIIRILSRAEKNNPVLLGEAGVGKTAVVQGLAQRIVRGDVPENLKGKIVIELSMGVLVAGTQYRGDFEQRMNNIIKETKDNRDVILFIDELHTLMGAGDKRHGLDGSNILKPALASGDLRLIGATTPGEYSRSIERDPAMERRFSPVWLGEIDKTMTRSVLDARKQMWEQHHGVSISDDALSAAVQLTDLHMRHRHFPDKAIDAVDEACAFARLGNGRGKDITVPVTRDHISYIINEWCGMESDDTILKSTSMIAEIQKTFDTLVIGHERIIHELTQIVAEIKLGLQISTTSRVLCFAGSAHCGKTQTARATAQALWPDEKDRFLFINCALLTDESDLNFLLGAAKGYIGSDSGGLLTLHLKQHPHSIVYLYHFADAHPKIQRFFGNLFAQGSFPDPDGRSVFVGSTIFILSVSSNEKNSCFGFGRKELSSCRKNTEQITEILKDFQVPDEVINAISESFWFDELSEEQMRKVIDQQFSRLIDQPGVSEFCADINKDIVVDRLVKEFIDTPAPLRDLPSMLNREAYGVIAEALCLPNSNGNL